VGKVRRKVLPILAAAGALLAAAPASAAPVIQTFAFTGADQTFTVPPGVVSASFTVTGAAGAGSAGGGGAGGKATATLPLTPGDEVKVFVGGAGAAGGFNGGGGGGLAGAGGGATDIRVGG
jgi:hypothetical protein